MKHLVKFVKQLAEATEYNMEQVISGIIFSLDAKLGFNERMITAQHAKVTDIIGRNSDTEADDMALAKAGEFLETLQQQNRELKEMRQLAATQYNETVGKAYEPYKKDEAKTSEVKKKAAALRKKYAA